MENLFFRVETLLSETLPFVLTLSSGIFLTIKCRWFQLRHPLIGLTYIFKSGGKEENSGTSTFQSVCTSLAATVGTGNIGGVAGAVAIGGAGAVFWMWVSSFFGMCIKLCEITLSVKYREKCGKKFTGGPMYYIRKGLGAGLAPLSTAFAAITVAASFGTGNFMQINTVVNSIKEDKALHLITGAAFALLVFVVLKGGASRVFSFTEKAIPAMSILYLLLSLGIIAVNYKSVPVAFVMIFKGAFNPSAVTGGAVGSVAAAMFTGAARGIYSNEAGLGTAGLAHASSENNDAVEEGLSGIFEVFADTVVICTATALAILCSGVKVPYGMYVSSGIVIEAFKSVYGAAAILFMPLMLILFAFTSIIGWGYYGIQCWGYLFGGKFTIIYTVLFSAACIAGAFFGNGIIWRISALMNGVMLIINLTAVLCLSGTAADCVNKYDARLKNEKKGSIINKKQSL